MKNKRFRCYNCENGTICWRDDSETQVTLYCSSCDLVYHQFSVRKSNKSPYCWFTNDSLMRMIIHNMKINDFEFWTGGEHGFEMSVEDGRKGLLFMKEHGDGSFSSKKELDIDSQPKKE